MASRVKFRRGTAVQHATFIGAEGEITVNTTTDSLVVHDGIQAGGYEMLRADLNNLDSATAIPAENITEIDCGSYS